MLPVNSGTEKPKVIIDTTWYWGGNRDRGIGRYIRAFLERLYSEDAWERVWLVPDSITQQQQQRFVKEFPGTVTRFPFGGSEGQQRGSWSQVLESHAAKGILIPSPFERPYSLLDLGSGLRSGGGGKRFPRLETILFDLIPLEYPGEVLATWSDADQTHYQQRIELLEQFDHIYSLSPATARALEQRLQFPARHVSVPEFVWDSEWLSVPKNIDRPSLQGVPVVTISGGEWRKNLAGTIEWFARAYTREHHLYVICKIGMRERIGFWWLAVRAGLFGRVHFLGTVSESQKWGWLFAAEGLLFLSHAEGLGVPLFEAARAGVPRIVLSRELAETGICEHLPEYVEVAVPIET